MLVDGTTVVTIKEFTFTAHATYCVKKKTI